MLLSGLIISGSNQRPKVMPRRLDMARSAAARPSGYLRGSTSQSDSERRVVVAAAEPAVVQHEALGPQAAAISAIAFSGRAGCGRNRPLPSNCSAPGAAARVGKLTIRSRRWRWNATRSRSARRRR